MAVRCKRRLIVPIFDADGNQYTNAGGQKAILIYAKKLTTEVDNDYPYDWWGDDTQGGAESPLVYGGGSALAAFASAQLEYLGNGIWVKDMDSANLDGENPDREDYYFVKIGTASSYGGPTDTSWTLVDGYNPISFGTLSIPPKAILNVLNFISDFEALDWSVIAAVGALIDTIGLNSAHRIGDGTDHLVLSGITAASVAEAAAVNANMLNELTNRLGVSTPLAEKIAALS